LRRAHNQLIAELESLRERDAARDRELERLRHHEERLRGELARLRGELHLARAATRDSKPQDTAPTERIEALQANNLALEAKAEALKATNEALESQLNGLKAQNQALEAENSELRAEFEALPAEVEVVGPDQELIGALEERVRRLSTDLKNQQRRQGDEVARAERATRSRLVRDFVETLDTMEQALAAHPNPDDPWVEGSRAIARQMEHVLRRAGVERLGDVGERFNPHEHEAVGLTSEADGVEPDHIAQVHQAGYRFAERVGEADALIRPARVVVVR